jgi:aspartate 1-decarboxylase
MSRIFTSSIALMAMVATNTQGFSPSDTRKRSLTLRQSMPFVGALQAVTTGSTDLPDFTDEVDTTPQPAGPKKEVAEKKAVPKPKGAATHKAGVFSPVVLTAKQVIGDERLNKIRAKVISMHSEVIGSFVDTYDSPIGKSVLKSLFEVADLNHNGNIDEAELSAAMETLGFSWLQAKQIAGIFKRADLDENGSIDFDEFMKEAPKTLRTNLIKLAKKNGDEMGLLS